MSTIFNPHGMSEIDTLRHRQQYPEATAIMVNAALASAPSATTTNPYGQATAIRDSTMHTRMGTIPDYSGTVVTGPMQPFQSQMPNRGNRLMSNEEIELHKRVALQMSRDTETYGPNGASAAQIKAYMDAVGVPQKKKMDYSWGVTSHFILGAVTSALHGATYGWDDEAIGSLYGLVMGSSAQAGRDAYRAHLAAFHEANPGTDFLFQLGGGIATGAGLAKGAATVATGVAPKLAPRAIDYLRNLNALVKVPGSAGLGGAAYGAGEAEGGLTQRLGGAAAGAVAGAVVGGLATGGLFAAGQIVKPVLRRLPGVKNAFPSPGQIADENIILDIERDGAKIPDMLQRAKAMIANGQTPTLGDLAGENVIGRMAAAQAIVGTGKQQILQGLVGRQKDSGDRILGWLTGQSKLGLANVEQVRNGLLGARSLVADRLYAEAYKHEAPMTDKLKAIFQDDIFKKAWNEARQELRTTQGIEVGPIERPFFPRGWTSRKPGTAGPAESIAPNSLPVAGLDWTKRYVDRIVRSGFKKDTGWDHGAAAGLSKKLDDALGEIDRLVPEYGAARKAYRGDSQVIDALDQGRMFLKTSADNIQLALAKHGSDAESEAYKLGAIEAIRDAIYNSHHKAPDVAQGIFGGKEMERRVQFLLGKDAPEFLDKMRVEARFAETLRGAARGSRTAPLIEVIQDWERQSAGIMGFLAARRPSLAFVNAARAVGVAIRKTHVEEVNKALADRLTLGLKDPAELIGYLLNLQSLKPHPSHLPRLAAAIGGQAAVQGGQ